MIRQQEFRGEAWPADLPGLLRQVATFIVQTQPALVHDLVVTCNGYVSIRVYYSPISHEDIGPPLFPDHP